LIGALVEDLQKLEDGKLRRFFLRRLRNRDDAADAMQETFLRLLSAKPRNLVENPQAYLFTMARNIAFDHERRENRRARIECPITDDAVILNIASGAPSAEEEIIDRQRLALFEQTLLALPERARTVLLLSRREGWSYQAIAQHLGISANTVYNDVRMAMGHCMAAMARLNG